MPTAIHDRIMAGTVGRIVSDPDVMYPLIFWVVAFLAAIAWDFRRDAQARKLLHEDWAVRESLRILACRKRILLKGPFLWTARYRAGVYRVTVQRDNGRIYNGWICCDSGWLGWFGNKLIVLWDDGSGTAGFPVVPLSR